MKSEKTVTSISVVLPILFVIVATPVGLYLFLENAFENYQHFLAWEKQSIPLFDDLNDGVYAELPLPPGVTEAKRERGRPVASYHAISLTIDYRIEKSNYREVFAHYKQYFSSTGWESNPINPVFNQQSFPQYFFYYRGTSCVEMEMLPGGYNLGDYRFVITHDLFKQTFSLTDPPISAIQLMTFGEAIFARCPPYSH